MPALEDRAPTAAARAGPSPTNAELGMALENALSAAGSARDMAAGLAAVARIQRLQYGLEEDMPVPRIPGKMTEPSDEAEDAAEDERHDGPVGRS